MVLARRGCASLARCRRGARALGSTSPAAIAVLVVEEDDEYRGLLAEFLAASGFEVASAASVAEAAAALASERPWHVVVTDLRLPDGDGWGVVRVARGRTPGVPVIVLTGWAPEPREAAERGVDALLPKPVRPNDLVDQIVRLARP